MEIFQYRCCFKEGWIFTPHTFLRPSTRMRRRPGHALPDLTQRPDRTALLITEADWARQVNEYSAPPQTTAKQLQAALRTLKKADLILRCIARGLATLGLVDVLRTRLTTLVSRDRAADATELTLAVCGLLPSFCDLRSPGATALERRTIRRQMLLQHVRTPARLYALAVAMDEALSTGPLGRPRTSPSLT